MAERRMESYEKEEGERMLLLAFMWYSAHELDSSAERVQSIKKGRAFSVLHYSTI